MRSHETVTTLATTPDVVWKAITDAEEITRWFAPIATVVPGPGGTVSVGWSAEATGSMTIEIWEPNRRLRLNDNRVVVDYFIESKEGVTTLRLVHSGFGDGSEWDGEYEGSKKGWPMFFKMLKFNLEQHPGEPQHQVSISLPVEASPDEQWSRLLGPQLGHLDIGAPYSLEMPGGDHLEGVVNSTDHQHLFAGTVENWNRALMTIFCEKYAGKGFLTVNLAVYGPLVAQAPEIEIRWRSALERLFECIPSS